MQKDTVIKAIHQVLEQQLNCPQLHLFSESARLNQDLYLDSVLVLQLLLGLELELGITIPDSALSEEDFDSVGSLAEFLLLQHQGPNQQVPVGSATDQSDSSAAADSADDNGEEFEDIKVHCFISCVCEIIKADERVDHRPFYFGVWDAEVVIDEQCRLNYHADNISHDFFRHWYQSLYGVEIKPWYRHDHDKAENIELLQQLLDSKGETEQLMVMLDMFRLPERENKFNQNPFPHYVMLEKTDDPDTLMMLDPDFRWQGTQSRQQVLHAVESDAVAGGYLFDSREIQPTSVHAVYEYFLACFQGDENPMTDCVETVINNHLSGAAPLENLSQALTQLPVLAIRKYSYEHGLAYFWRALDLPDAEFEDWCDVIEALVSSYKKIQYRVMKLAQIQLPNGNTIDQVAEALPLMAEIKTLLARQNAREFQIKARLYQVFDLWCQQQGFAVPPYPRAQKVEPIATQPEPAL